MKKILTDINVMRLLCIILFAFLVRSCSDSIIKNKENKDLVSSLNAEIETWRSSDSLHHAKIRIIETENTKSFLKIKSSDSTIISLQNLVSKYKKELKEGSSITKIEGNTSIDTNSPTEVVYKDTVKIDSIIYVYPQYNSSFNLNNWVKGNVSSDKDTTNISLTIKNSYSVIIGEDRSSIFKSGKPFVEVINDNPYSETTSIRTYRVSKKPIKNFSIGPSINLGYSNEGKIISSLGIGIQYSILRL